MKLIHNGYKILFPETMADVNNYIDSVLSQHRDLEPRKIMEKTVTLHKGNRVRIIRWMYKTIYEEDFIIELDD